MNAEQNKNRYNIGYCNGFVINVIPLFMASYFPMQKFLNIFPNTSSVVICPVISPR